MYRFKSYKFRIYPNSSQETLISKTFGCVRVMWNELVAQFNQPNEFIGPRFKITPKNIKLVFPFMKEVPYVALESKFLDFAETKRQFFDKKRKVKLGRMNFKKKGMCSDSFRISNGPGNIQIDLHKNAIKLIKFGKIKCIFDRKIPNDAKLLSVTLSKNKANQYFISILVEEEIRCKSNTGNSVGIDVGLIHFITLSNGLKFKNLKWFRENQAKLAKSQRHLSRKEKGSGRYEKQRLKVARIYNDITNQRDWYLHNLSCWIVNNFDHIFVENLNISGMKRNRRVSKSISDASWAEFFRQLEYKSLWYGREFHKIDRFFASSKICFDCGYIVNSMNLSVREWNCPQCGSIHDRDINAANNIKKKGFLELYKIKLDEYIDYRHGEDIRPVGIMADFCEVLSLS